MNQLSLLLIASALFMMGCNEQHSNNSTSAEKEEKTASLEETNPAKLLVGEMVTAIGGIEKLMALKDVEYQYTYRDAEGVEDVSLERYLFDGELSWARYDKHDKFVFPGQEGSVIQSYDGEISYTTLAGKKIEDPQAVKLADFMRKTNYYWFAMMFKLLDEGIDYELLEDGLVDGKTYKRVKISYADGVGDAQDIYLLYLDPETKLVDQFLFTVMDFGMADPNLMKVTYEEIEGLKIPTYRKYTRSDWEGNVKEDKWVEEISKEVKFNNGFTRDLFSEQTKS